MDKFSKSVLVIMTILLAVIAVGVWVPYIERGHARQRPTLGDMLGLRDIQDPDIQKKTRLELIHSIPYIKVYGSSD